MSRDVFEIKGRAYRTVATMLFIGFGIPIIAVLYMFIFESVTNPISYLMMLLILFPFTVIGTTAGVLGYREKTIRIDERTISYRVGKKLKWRARLNKIKKVRLRMGGRRIKVLLFTLQTNKHTSVLSSENVSHSMIRRSYNELMDRLEEMGIDVEVEDRLHERF